MTMQAVQSALAIRRQRSRREEQRRANARRYSTQSDNLILSPTASSFRGSFLSLDSQARARDAENQRKNILSTKVMGTVTTFHVGLVFIMIGLMLMVSSLVPGYMIRDWQELLSTGCLLLFMGVVLLIINRIVSSQEDKQFSRTIRKKLAASRINGPTKLLMVSNSRSTDCTLLTRDNQEENPHMESIAEENKEVAEKLPEAEETSQGKTQASSAADIKIQIDPA